MASIEQSVEVDQPVSTVYNQWTQFEEFPQFMKDVDRVEQIDDRRLHWKAEIAGVSREWDAVISEQQPDEVVAWRAEGDTGHSGRVTFDRIDTSTTRVNLHLEYHPEGLLEQAGDKLGLIQRQAGSDLEQFKEFIESRGTESGSWRGNL